MRVLEGHPFIVEAAVSLGGRDIRPGINVYRFANRIPLLFEVTPSMCSAAVQQPLQPHANDSASGFSLPARACDLSVWSILAT